MNTATAIPPTVGGPSPTDEATALSPEWISAALSVGAGVPVEVGRVTEAWRQENMATKIRFEVEYVGATPEGLGRAFCLKGVYGESKIPTMVAKVSQGEIGFYTDVKPRSAVRVPTARYAGIDPETGRGSLLMDDLVAEGARFLTALEPYTPDQAADSLRQLATLHAETWGLTGAAMLPWLSNRLSDIIEVPIIDVEPLQGLMEDGRNDPLQAWLVDAPRLHRALVGLSAALADGPHSLVHGDAHAGNIYVLDGAPALIDWQLLQVNSWAIDVAYHLGAVLDTETRRAVERDLVRGYLAELSARGADAPGWDQAWRAYRASTIYGYYMWSVTRFVDRTVTLEFNKRLGTAVADHDAYRLVGA